MKHSCWFLPVLIGGLFFAVPLVDPAPASAMRCGSRLVRMGQTRSEVRRLCGTPLDVVQSELVRSRAVASRFRSVSVVDGVGHITQVERWVYSLGRGRFLREVTFHDGQVVRVKRLRGRSR